jgi:hypothetical protein
MPRVAARADAVLAVLAHFGAILRSTTFDAPALVGGGGGDVDGAIDVDAPIDDRDAQAHEATLHDAWRARSAPAAAALIRRVARVAFRRHDERDVDVVVAAASAGAAALQHDRSADAALWRASIPRVAWLYVERDSERIVARAWHVVVTQRVAAAAWPNVVHNVLVDPFDD